MLITDAKQIIGVPNVFPYHMWKQLEDGTLTTFYFSMKFLEDEHYAVFVNGQLQSDVVVKDQSIVFATPPISSADIRLMPVEIDPCQK